MNEKNKNILKNPWIYFLVTFVWTWLFWGIAILRGVSLESVEGSLILLAGVLGPMITGIAFTYLTQDAEGRKSYWKRVRNFRAISARWYLILFLFVPVLNVLAALIDVLMGGSGATWGETALNFLTDPVSLFFSIIFSSLIPFIEELGWRGYVLDRLQERHSVVLSSLILGVIWSLWHLPMFFIPDSYQAGLGIGTLEFWLFFTSIVPLTFVISWIYNNTGRSILAAILFHSMVNFTGELIALNSRSDTIASVLWFVAAIGIVLLWRERKQSASKAVAA